MNSNETTQTTTKQDVYYDADKVARMLGVLPGTWLRWVDEGQAPQPIEVDGAPQWLAGDLLEWVKRLKGASAA